jgi:hypothetical protein
VIVTDSVAPRLAVATSLKQRQLVLGV